MTHNLTEYICIDEAALDTYIEQISVEPVTERKKTKKVSLSITGPAVEMDEEVSTRPLTTHEKIQKLTEYLRKHNLLAERRPIQCPSYESPDNQSFVYETMIARKVIVPQKQIEDMGGLRELAVWISEPSEGDFHDGPWDWGGTFLYLTEVHWDHNRYRTVWSGCSALQAVVNAANNTKLITPNHDEPFGRWCNKHPIEKLQEIGAIATAPRKITSLYRKRYVTDEQCYIINGKEQRVNDLLAYPVFIAATD